MKKLGGGEHYLLACARLSDKIVDTYLKRANEGYSKIVVKSFSKKRCQKPAVPPLPFSRSRASYFRSARFKYVSTILSESLAQANYLLAVKFDTAVAITRFSLES